MLTSNDGEWLRGVQFITNKGRCSAIYGWLDGIPTISRSEGGVLAGLLISTKKHETHGRLVTGVNVSSMLCQINSRWNSPPYVGSLASRCYTQGAEGKWRILRIFWWNNPAREGLQWSVNNSIREPEGWLQPVRGLCWILQSPSRLWQCRNCTDCPNRLCWSVEDSNTSHCTTELDQSIHRCKSHGIYPEWERNTTMIFLRKSTL